ncbi:MAG: signal peptide peptidase SppA [Nitrospinae bacterium]|nr:signal peptide peptidase SppA [Nitrospinota bacterium]
MKKRNIILVGFIILSLLTGFLFLIAIIINSFLLEDGIWDKGDKIALINIEGIITDSRDIIKQITKYKEDSSIKGIVLNINSPGGGVAPSQEIYKEILKLHDNNKKVVVSMGSLAASGGYYIACAADRIVANPGTITGSIGVIMTFSNIEELMKKIGFKIDVIKSGRYKDIGSPNRSITDEERDILQEVIDDVYDQFIEAVAKGRKMDSGRVKELADGRVFSGRQAQQIGLLDELGNLQDAFSIMAEMVGIKGKPKIVEERKKKGFLFRYFTERFSSICFPDNLNHTNFGLHYLWFY